MWIYNIDDLFFFLKIRLRQIYIFSPVDYSDTFPRIEGELARADIFVGSKHLALSKLDVLED